MWSECKRNTFAKSKNFTLSNRFGLDTSCCCSFWVKSENVFGAYITKILTKKQKTKPNRQKYE